MIPLIFVLIFLLCLITVLLYRIFRILLDVVPHIKYPRYTGGSAAPEGYQEVASKDVRKTLDAKIAERSASRVDTSDTFESYTENLGEEVIIDDK